MGEYDKKFQELINQIGQGSEDAAHELVQRFGKAILRAVRRRLHRKLRTHLDSHDIVQEVFASFFCNTAPGRRFSDPESLIRFLSVVARNKVIDKVRKRRLHKHTNINRQYSLDGSAKWAAQTMYAADPTPSHIVQRKEGWQQLRETLTPQANAILELLAAGHSQLEITRRLGLANPKIVRKVIEKVRQARGII